MDITDIHNRDDMKTYWQEIIFSWPWETSRGETARRNLLPIAEKLEANDWVHYLKSLEGYPSDHIESEKRLSAYIDTIKLNEKADEWLTIHALFCLIFILSTLNKKDTAFHLSNEIIKNYKNSTHLGTIRIVAMTLIRAIVLVNELNNPIDVNTYLNELRTLATTHADPVIREQLAKALVNTGIATGNSGDLAAVNTLLDELREMATAHHDEPVIRELLAKALVNAGHFSGESGDVAVVNTFLDELRNLAKGHPDEPTIREALAKALVNTGNSGDLATVNTLLDELREMATAHPDESAIREALAKALVNSGAVAGNSGDLAAVNRLLDELREMTKDHPVEPTIREQLAKALVNAAAAAGNSGDLATVKRLLDEWREMATAHPDESAILEQLVKALANAGNDTGNSGDLETVNRLLDELREMATAHPDEPATREKLAKALFNSGNDARKSGDLAAVNRLLDGLREMTKDHPDEPAIREQLAKALVNAAAAAGNSGDLAAVKRLLDELREMAKDHPDEPAIREQLAMALHNTGYYAGESGDLKTMNTLLGDLREMAKGRPDEPAIRELLAKALVNASNDAAKSGDLATVNRLFNELREMAKDHPDEPAIREQLAKVLVNTVFATGNSGDLAAVKRLLDELRELAKDHPDEPAIRELLATALFNAGNDARKSGDLAAVNRLLDDLREMAKDHPDEPIIRELLAKAFVNAGHFAGESGDLATVNTLLSELREIAKNFPDGPVIREALAKALFNYGIFLSIFQETHNAYLAYAEAEKLLREFSDENSRRLRDLAAINKNRLRITLGLPEEAPMEATPCEQAQADASAPAAFPLKHDVPREGEERPSDSPNQRTEPEEAIKTEARIEAPQEMTTRTDMIIALDNVIDKFKEVKERFLAEMDRRKKRVKLFLSPKGRFEKDASVLMVLRQWNSYTPIIADGQESDRGGGYFVRHKDLGLVIDPGYNFIELFHKAGCKIVDITHVAVTHAHDDHTAQIEQLLTMFHQFNGTGGYEHKKVTLLLNHSTMKKFSGFSLHNNCPYIDKVICLNAFDSDNLQTLNLTKFGDFSITVLPAYHDDVFTKDYAVGLGLLITVDGEQRRIIFTGDTGLYPLDLNLSGNPQYYSGKYTRERRVKEKEGDGIYNKYLGIFGDKKIDLLVPHLGSIKEYEFDPQQPTKPIPASSDGTKENEDTLSDVPMFYPNHLGLLGTAILIMKLKPSAVILSEFGSELKGLRMEIAKLLGEALGKTMGEDQVPFIIPGDPGIVYNIQGGTFLCHEDGLYNDQKDLESKEVGDDRIGLFKKGGSYASMDRFDKSLQMLENSEKESVRAFKIPYMRESDS